jgi:hypothetical protein
MKAKNVRGMNGRYETNDLSLIEMIEDIRDINHEASIMDAEIEIGQNGLVVIGDTGEISPIEMRQMSELEQAMREETGLPLKPIMAHPYGHRRNGNDVHDDKFGKSVIVRRLRTPATAPQPAIKTVRIPKEGDVEVYLGLDGLWKPVRIPRYANQFEIETLAWQEFEQEVALRECPEPESRRNYYLRVVCCENRDNAVWIRCVHKDEVKDEEAIIIINNIYLVRPLRGARLHRTTARRPGEPGGADGNPLRVAGN